MLLCVVRDAEGEKCSNGFFLNHCGLKVKTVVSHEIHVCVMSKRGQGERDGCAREQEMCDPMHHFELLLYFKSGRTR